MLEGEVSHDRITRFLSSEDYDSKTLWRLVKPMAREIECEDGVLIFDDTIQEKPHTDENEIITWHFDHTRNRSVKGINLLNCVYHADGMSVPVAYEIIHKPIEFTDKDTGRSKRRSEVSKNELMRRMLRVCENNGLRYRYVLADSWFSSKKNMDFIHRNLKRHFAIAIKSNRTVALSCEEKLAGRFERIDTLEMPDCFMSIYSACRPEWLSVRHRMNHFASRTRIYISRLSDTPLTNCNYSRLRKVS